VRVEGVWFPRNQVQAPAELAFSLVTVVGTASQLNILGGGGTPSRIRHDVMELQEGLLGAPAAIVGHINAHSSVTVPHRAPDCGRDVARTAGHTLARSGPLRGGKLFPGQILEQRRQRSIEDFAEVPIRNLMT